jgi:cellulose synthase/poly-beta-1,6-N-acetylglucosamine synthase-like glycosyltransferase
MDHVRTAIELTILLYFLGMNGGYLFLNLFAWFAIQRHEQLAGRLDLQGPLKQFLRPVSLIVPAWNEEDFIIETVRSLQKQQYGETEIIVVSDGSTDDTIDVMIERFDMEPVKAVYRDPIETAPVRRIYRSKTHPNLRLVEKENAGRYDALNAATNLAEYPLVATCDADTLMEEDTILRMAQPFHENENTIHSGGAVRVLNGCRTEDGSVVEALLPERMVPLLQVVEYLRAFQFGRMGWSVIRALLINSGTAGMFRRTVLTEVGGFRDTVAEDLEMTTRLQRIYRNKDEPHEISFTPDAFCWTKVPDTIRSLGHQRARWQRGVGTSLSMNATMPFSSGAGTAGWIAFPFFVLFEFLGPLLELLAFGYFLYILVAGPFNIAFILGFLLFAVVFGIFLSFTAILQEQICYRAYRFESGVVWKLLLAAILENFGYRQILTYYRLKGVFQFLFTKQGGSYK